MIEDKLIPFESIRELCKEQRAKGKVLVFTNGCFDIVHSGHVLYLEEAKALGDILVLGLNSDASVTRLKGESRPINSEIDRAIVLAGLEAIDYVVIFGEDTPENLIREVGPDILVKGGDWRPDQIVGADFVLASGGIVKSLSYKKGISTTAILERLCKKNS